MGRLIKFKIFPILLRLPLLLMPATNGRQATALSENIYQKEFERSYDDGETRWSTYAKQLKRIAYHIKQLPLQSKAQ